jgi:hypothetical protein
MPLARTVASSGMRRLLALLPAAVLAVGAAVLGAANPIEFSSSWRTEPIRIDGNNEDWHGHIRAVTGQKFSIGLLNDADAVYVCLITTDRVLSQQIMRQGLMVWLDPASTNPKKHTFGVHFPIDPRLMAMRDPDTIYSRDASPGMGPDVGQTAVGILGAKGDPTRVPIEESGGIQARLALHGDALVYELKVPLKGSAAGPYSVDVDPGGSLRLELETPEWRGPLPPQRGPVSVGVAVPAPGGRGGVVGYPAMDATLLKPMNMKASVRLASGQ